MSTKRRGLKLQVVAPCNEDWDEMSGGDDIRFCGKCRQNVYNLSEMTESQARELVQGAACVRFFHRGDGTVITQKCPPMMEAARRRLVALAAGVAGVLPLAAGFWGSVAWLRKLVHGRAGTMGTPIPPRATMGEPMPVKPKEPPREERGQVMMGAPPPPPRLMGKPVAPKAKLMGRAAK